MRKTRLKLRRERNILAAPSSLSRFPTRIPSLLAPQQSQLPFRNALNLTFLELTGKLEIRFGIFVRLTFNKMKIFSARNDYHPTQPERRSWKNNNNNASGSSSANAGKRVGIVDLDKQETATKWTRSLGEEKIEIVRPGENYDVTPMIPLRI